MTTGRGRGRKWGVGRGPDNGLPAGSRGNDYTQPKRGKRQEVAQAMSWERGYYYRVRKVNGRVVREYVGRGPLAELIAEADADRRREREARRAASREEKAELEALDAPLNELNEVADLLARAALMAAGFHQHKRGEWRKRRAEHDEGRRDEA